MNLKQIYSKLFESYGYFEDNITELDGKYYLDIFYDALVDLQNIVDNFNVKFEPKVSELDKAFAGLKKAKDELFEAIDSLKAKDFSEALKDEQNGI